MSGGRSKAIRAICAPYIETHGAVVARRLLVEAKRRYLDTRDMADVRRHVAHLAENPAAIRRKARAPLTIYRDPTKKRRRTKEQKAGEKVSAVARMIAAARSISGISGPM